MTAPTLARPTVHPEDVARLIASIRTADDILDDLLDEDVETCHGIDLTRLEPCDSIADSDDGMCCWCRAAVRAGTAEVTA
jgi:hypothetical protein